jgi:hypothetical protein
MYESIVEHEARHIAWHEARTDRWTNVRTNPTRKPTPTRERVNDYPPGPYAWTEKQGRACFEAHAWAGGAALGMALMMAWREDRPPCWPPYHVVDAETAILVLLNKTARIKRAKNAIKEVQA